MCTRKGHAWSSGVFLSTARHIRPWAKRGHKESVDTNGPRVHIGYMLFDLLDSLSDRKNQDILLVVLGIAALVVFVAGVVAK